MRAQHLLRSTKKIDLLVAETKAIFSTPAPKVEAPKADEAKAETEPDAGA